MTFGVFKCCFDFCFFGVISSQLFSETLALCEKEKVFFLSRIGVSDAISIPRNAHVKHVLP